MTINDSFIILNQNDDGPGITKSPAWGGFGVYRGMGNPSFQLFFDEADDTINIGLSDALKYIPAMPKLQTSGLTAWNATTKCFEPTTTHDLSIANLTSTGTITIGGQTYTWPTVQGTSNQVLKTNGTNTLFWSTVTGGGGGGGDSIVNGTGLSSVEVDRFGFAETVYIRANNVDAQTITNDQTTISNQLQVGGNFAITPTTTSTANYTVQTGDAFINWTSPSDGSISLPSAATNSGRIIIIQNKSINTMSINPNGTDRIDGILSTNIELNSQYDNTKLISDGINNWIII